MKEIKYYGKVLTITLMILAVTAITFILPIKETSVQAEPLDTYHSSWHLIRALAAEDGANFAAGIDLAGSEGDYANIPTDAFQVRSVMSETGPHEGYSAGGAWIFVFGCSTTDSDDDNETFSFTLVGWAKSNGMAQVLCEGDGVAGTQDVVIYPGGSATDANDVWADTVNLDETTKWPGVAVYNSGDNEVCMLVVDTTGLEYVYPYIYDAAGSSEAAAVAVYGRRY